MAVCAFEFLVCFAQRLDFFFEELKMNKTLVARLVIGALATIAAGGAMAGQIQASSVSVAREVITTDTQTILAPSVAYRFAGDVDARVQAQTFQVQFTLGNGTWAAAPGANAISVTDSSSSVIQDQSAAAPVAPAVASYTVLATGLSSDSKTMWATIVVNQGATALIREPLISLNVTANMINGGAATDVSASRGTLNNLYTLVGDLLADYASNGACVAVKTLPVDFKHFVALTSPSTMADSTTATADEHVRAGSTNNTTLVTFPTNLKVNVTSATGGVTLAAGGNLTFLLKSPGTAYIDATHALLGTVHMSQNAIGYDSDLSHQYLLNAGPGVLGQTTATMHTGPVEAKDLKVVVSATNGYVVGGTMSLSTTADCTSGTIPGSTVAITSANAAGPITLNVPTAQVNAALGATGTDTVKVCYTVPGTVTIPSSAFTAVATLEKADAGTNLDEQDNICNGSYISLGGGLKVDLRNYASSKETSGYVSIVRFVNNSDSSTADVWAQIIHQDGKLGGWGKLADLAPRAVLNMTAAQIEAKLTNAATAAIGATEVTPETNNTGAPRLRITSNSGRSIRVQNYMFNAATGQILEVSGAQGVDFEGTTDRAPLSEGQYQIQDANSGLNLQ